MKKLGGKISCSLVMLFALPTVALAAVLDSKEGASSVAEESGKAAMNSVSNASDVTELSSKVKALEKAVDSLRNVTSDVTSDYIYVALAVAAVALLVAIVGLFMADKEAAKNKKARRVMFDNRKRLDALDKALGEANEEIARLRLLNEQVSARLNSTSSRMDSMASMMQTPHTEQPLKEEASKESELFKAQIEAFVADYNAMRQVSGLGAREARQEFSSKYGIKGFKCAKNEERVNHQETKPSFEAVDKLVDATLWAFTIGDSYAVLPNLKAYEWSVHATGGMKELFNSNYAGGSYNRITAIKPAILTPELDVKAKGELALS